MLVKVVALCLYTALIIIIGIVGLRKTKTFSDFFLGGGKVGPWMTAFSYGTAYFSAVLFIGFAGKIGWAFGYSSLWITLCNSFIGVLAVWGLLGWRIKQMSIEYSISTLSDFFLIRYSSTFLKIFSAFAIFIFLIPYSAAVFMGLSYLFTVNFGVAYWVALLFMGLLTALYLVMGGYKSMAMMDTIFGIIMTVGVITLFISTIIKGNGFTTISASLAAINPKLTEAVGPPGLWPLFSLAFLTSIAPFAMPQLIQKFYAVKDKNTIKTGMIASTFFALLISGVAYFVGSTTRIFLTPDSAPNAFKAGKPLFDRLMPELLTNVIPSSLSVLILLLILSASMSTLASLVLVSSSTFAKDFYASYINKKISDQKLTRLMRYTSALFVLLSVLLAYANFDTIVTILGISWGALGATFLGPFVWGLFTKRVSKVAAIASSVLGLSSCLILYFLGMSSPEAGTIGMLVSLIIPAFDYFRFKI